MPRFFVSDREESIRDGRITIKGEDAVHISRSLRMRVGEELTVSDFFGTEYQCVISDFSSSTVTLDIVSERKCESEPSVKVTVFQAVPKGDKMDTVVQKCTELGACGFVPVMSSRCVSRPDAKSGAKKCERWQKISAEAAKQSGRGIIPAVSGILEFKDAIAEMCRADVAVMCYECEDGNSVRSVITRAISDGRLSAKCVSCGESSSVAVFIGPEGGISPDEAEYARNSGVELCGLGKRILRTETAPLFAVSAIMLLTGNAE